MELELKKYTFDEKTIMPLSAEASLADKENWLLRKIEHKGDEKPWDFSESEKKYIEEILKASDKYAEALSRFTARVQKEEKAETSSYNKYLFVIISIGVFLLYGLGKWLYSVVVTQPATISGVKSSLPGEYAVKAITEGGRNVWVKIKIDKNLNYSIWEEEPSSGNWGVVDKIGKIRSIKEQRFNDNGEKYIQVQLPYMFGSNFYLTYEDEFYYDSPYLWINSEALGRMEEGNTNFWN